MKLDPEFLQIEDLVAGTCVFSMLIITSIFLWWSGSQVLEDYSKQIKTKWKKVYPKRISIYQNQDDIV